MNGDVADRRGRVGLEHRLERDAVVDRLEHAADGITDIDNVGIGFRYRDVVDAPAHARWSNAAKDEALQHRIGGPVDRGWSWTRTRTRPRNLRTLRGRLNSLAFGVNGYGSESHSKSDHNEQSKIVNGARPVFHAKVSFQLKLFPKLRGKAAERWCGI
jgi:hypothetical protein